MLVKAPPAYMVEPFTTSALTTSSAIGFQAETLLSAMTWAMFDLGTPPTEVKLPPMNQPPEPSAATAETEPTTFGKPATGRPLVESMGTAEPVAGPT